MMRYNSMQKLLVYKGKVSCDELILRLTKMFSNYYITNVSGLNILHNKDDPIIVIDIGSFFIQNNSKLFNNLYVWYDDKIEYKYNGYSIDALTIIENNINVINGIISDKYYPAMKHIQYTSVHQLLQLFGFYGRTSKVKLLCNWEKSEVIVKQYAKLCKIDNLWDNIELTYENDADYYVIINYPREGDYYNSAKTIVVMMEELVNRASYFPTDWIEPMHHKFMYYHNKINGIEWHLDKTYSQLMSMTIDKTKILSSVTSSEYRLDGHIKRINLLKYLDSRITFDLYGKSNKFDMRNYKGSLPYLKKDDGLFPYKYTIACENNEREGYFTEKLVDAILSECLCFYWGCPNISEYIDDRAFIKIDVNDHIGAEKTILDAINNNEWEKRLMYIRREKLKILNELQLMPTICDIIESSKITPDYNNNKLSSYHEYREKYLYFHGDDHMINVVNSICKHVTKYIESGAYRGANSLYIKTYFPNIEINTCETNIMSYMISKNNVQETDTVKIYNGPSMSMYKNIGIKSNEPILFYLDANSNMDTPLIDELNYIFENCESYYIIIDDFKNEFSDKFQYNAHLKDYNISSIKSHIPRDAGIYFPKYTDKTSVYHPLVGWVLITNYVMTNDNLLMYNIPNDVQIKIVNLKRRLDRMESMNNEFNAKSMLNYMRFDAVDGRKLVASDEILKMFHVPDGYIGKRWQITHNWNIGILGCALSHINLWKKLLDSGLRGYIVFEDDIELKEDFDNRLIKCMHDISAYDCDILYFGFNDNSMIDGDYYINNNLIKLSKNMRINGGGTYGYYITKSGAQKLLLAVEQNGIQQPIDHFMIDRFDELNIYRASPYIISAETYGTKNNDTDIQNVKTSLV